MTKSVFTDKYEQFRQMLVESRKAAGLTQAELAARLSRPQSYVSKYERGERRLDMIEFLEVARVMDLNPVTFIQNLQQMSNANADRVQRFQ